MVMSFGYGPVPFSLGYRPIIPVVLINRLDPNDLIAEGMLVDSGADLSVISERLAKRLNLILDPNKLVDLSGIGGVSKGIPTNVEIILHRGGEGYLIEIPIHVILNKSNLPYPLLGRIPIFDIFEITFRQEKLKINFNNKSNYPRTKIPDKLYRTKKN